MEKFLEEKIPQGAAMLADFYNRTCEVFREVESFLPSTGGNVCLACNICCSSVASLGVTELEFDYIHEFLERSGRDVEGAALFRDYIFTVRKPPDVRPQKLICPFYDRKAEGCAIYEVRPLSCRTYGHFIREDLLGLIPERCVLKKNVVIYKEETFFRYLPFTIPFFTLAFAYDDHLLSSAELLQQRIKGQEHGNDDKADDDPREKDEEGLNEHRE
ncbi:MAG: YkgJ family cysteine cluster protein [Candidatus Eremiobacteraeota bacterium]|nr:YkgJ family cysteine cluster protein [Candidatus Eremiobacteraeota bacterium]